MILVDAVYYPPRTHSDSIVLCTPFLREASELADGRGVVVRVEDSPAHHEHIDARARELLDVFDARAAVDLEKMPGVAITCDCDVIRADGGTRTAAITGAFVALADAVAAAREQGLIQKNPIHGPVAAISVGIIDGQPHLDLDYPLDVHAEVDMNVAMNHEGEFIEIQGTGEAGTFSRAESDALLDLATKGIKRLIRAQRVALKS